MQIWERRIRFCALVVLAAIHVPSSISRCAFKSMAQRCALALKRVGPITRGSLAKPGDRDFLQMVLSARARADCNSSDDQRSQYRPTISR